MKNKNRKQVFASLIIILLIALLVPLIYEVANFASGFNSETSTYYRGVNLFGGWQSLYSGQDTFAPPAVLDYFKTKGLDTFRVGFAWEKLQPTLNGPLDTAYLTKMDTLVANVKARNQRLTFVPLPGLYKGKNVATAEVPQAAYNDMLKKLAEKYKNESAVWAYSLINEPNMGDVWNTTIAPSAIAAIRTVDMNKPIIVPTSTGGYGHFFKHHLVNLPMPDPGNNLIYEAHFYFDTPPNGQYPNGFDVPGGDLDIGVKNAKDFVEWCVTGNHKCFAGEYGIPGGWSSGDQSCNYLGGTNKDPRWLDVLDRFLTYLDQNKISGAYWAGGPYGDINSVGPFCENGNFVDGPQMAILVKHLGSNASSPTCKGDYNNDRQVTIFDFGIFAQNYNKTGINCNLDLIGNNCKLDAADLSEFVKVYRRSC